jgi:hypothetical protein
MNSKDVDPKIKHYFPWALFLALAALLAMGAMMVHAHAADLPEPSKFACYGSAREEAMSSGWTPCDEMNTLCDKVKAYLTTHTKAEAYAAAAEKHLPQWLIRKAERCVP